MIYSFLNLNEFYFFLHLTSALNPSMDLNNSKWLILFNTVTSVLEAAASLFKKQRQLAFLPIPKLTLGDKFIKFHEN